MIDLPDISINGQRVPVHDLPETEGLSLRQHHQLEIADVIVRYNDEFLMGHWRLALSAVTMNRDDTAPWLAVLHYADEGDTLDVRCRLGERSSFSLERGEVVVGFPNPNLEPDGTQ